MRKVVSSIVTNPVFYSCFEWEELKTTAVNNYPSNRNCHTSVIFSKYMIIFGGKEGEGKKKFVNDIHVLDLEESTWHSQLKINGQSPEPRMGHSAQLFHENKMVVYGGWNGYSVLEDVHYLACTITDNHLTLEWIPIKVEGYSPKRQFHTANIHGKKMYVFGGGDGKYWLNDLYIFDLDIQKWQLIEVSGKIPTGRLQHSSVMYNKKLYIFGGEPDRLRQLNDIYVFDVDKSVWSELVPMGCPPSPRVSATSVVVSNKIYFFGGYDGLSWRNDMFNLSLDDNTWETVYTSNVPPKHRCRHSASLYKNSIVIFGGNDSEKSYNDVHILKMQITIKTDDSSISQDLKAMFEDKEFCDIIFVIDNEELPAHKALLSARCERFKAMFTSKLETDIGQLMESQTKRIVINDTKSNIFRAMLEYLYTDDTLIDDTVAADLLILSNQYLLTRLKNRCEEYLARKMSVKNIVDVINLAERHEALFLKDYALRFMIMNHNVICETQDISKLSKEILVELFKIKKLSTRLT